MIGGSFLALKLYAELPHTLRPFFSYAISSYRERALQKEICIVYTTTTKRGKVKKLLVTLNLHTFLTKSIENDIG